MPVSLVLWCLLPSARHAAYMHLSCTDSRDSFLSTLPLVVSFSLLQQCSLSSIKYRVRVQYVISLYSTCHSDSQGSRSSTPRSGCCPCNDPWTPADLCHQTPERLRSARRPRTSRAERRRLHTCILPDPGDSRPHRNPPGCWGGRHERDHLLPLIMAWQRHVHRGRQAACLLPCPCAVLCTCKQQSVGEGVKTKWHVAGSTYVDKHASSRAFEVLCLIEFVSYVIELVANNTMQNIPYTAGILGALTII